jgi:site-specific DNA-methyltransferase (adenine-specific)
MTFNNKALMNSKYQNWKTPIELYEELDKEFNFDFDPCPINPLFNGLEICWKDRNFVNPPYNEVDKWLAKNELELKRGCMSVFLIFARTDTKWFHKYIYMKKNVEIRFLKGRLKFLDENNNIKYPAPAPSMIVIFRKV